MVREKLLKILDEFKQHGQQQIAAREADKEKIRHLLEQSSQEREIKKDHVGIKTRVKRLLEDLVRSNPGEFLKRADEAYSRGSYKEAIEIYEKLLGKHEDNGLLKKAGECYLQLGRNREAIEIVSRALRQAESDTELYLIAAGAYENVGDMDLALQAYKKAGEIAGNDYRIWFNQGNFLKKQGKLEDAISSYKHALEAQDNPEAWLGIARTYYSGQDFREAEKAYGMAFEITKSPENGKEYIDFLFETGDYKKALQISDEMSFGHPDDSALLAKRTELLQRMGRADTYQKQGELKAGLFGGSVG